MKRFLLFLLALNASCFLRAQPGIMYKDLRLGLYDPQGKPIDSANTQYKVSFQLANDKNATPHRYKNKKFMVSMIHGDEININIHHKRSGKTMMIHTRGSLDSLVFNEGEYSFDLHEAFLFSIHAVGTNILNKNIENFAIGKPHHFPVFYLEEDPEEQHVETRHCYNMAAEMEKIHGGKNWIRNICNDIYEDHVHSTDTVVQARINTLEARQQNLRTQVYPYKQNMFIRHVADLSGTYDHTISLSTDGCLSWKTLLKIKGEWYVHLIFFPGSGRVGIDISNSGVVLLSDHILSDWKFYLLDHSEEPPACKTEAWLLKNAGWMEDALAKFYFSE